MMNIESAAWDVLLPLIVAVVTIAVIRLYFLLQMNKPECRNASTHTSNDKVSANNISGIACISERIQDVISQDSTQPDHSAVPEAVEHTNLIENIIDFPAEFAAAIKLKASNFLSESETRLRFLALRAPTSEKAKVMQELISVLKLQGKLDDCVLVHEELLQHFKKCFGPNNHRTLKQQVKLGTMFQRCSRFTDAEITLRQTLSAFQRFVGTDDAGTIECLSSLAFLLNQQGRLDEAEPMLYNALVGSRRAFGNDHIKTLLVQNNLAALLMNRGALAEAASDIPRASELYDSAERIMREAFTLQMASVGESHAITQQTMHNLAALLHARHTDSEEAIEFMRRAVRSRAASLGESNVLTLASQSSLVTMLLKCGGQGILEAEAILRQMCSIHYDSIDEWVKAVRKLALILKNKGNEESLFQAKDLLLQLLHRQDQNGSSKDSIVETLTALWDTWFVLGNAAAAVEVLRLCIKFKMEVYGTESDVVLQDQSSLAALLEKNEELGLEGNGISEAEHLYRHIAHVQREVLGNSHCSTCLAMYNLAAFLLIHRSSQRDEAAELLRLAHSGWATALGEAHEDTKDALRLLQQCRQVAV